MTQQRVRKAIIADMKILQYTSFVKCAACGKNEEGWFLHMNLEVKNTTESKACPATLAVHLKCLLGSVPALLLDKDWVFHYDIQTDSIGHIEDKV